jgi:hypothetical protein
VIAGHDSRDPLTSMACAGERFAGMSEGVSMTFSCRRDIPSNRQVEISNDELLHARCDSPVGFLSSPRPYEQANLPMYIRANAASDSPYSGHIELDMCVSARSIIGGGVT